MKKNKNKTLSMNEVTKNYEKFIANKKTKDNSRPAFDNAIRKAATTKQRGSK